MPLPLKTALDPSGSSLNDSRGRRRTERVPDASQTRRLTDEEKEALRVRAGVEGISMQEAARRAVRDYVARSAHGDRVFAAADRVLDAHADAIERLGR